MYLQVAPFKELRILSIIDLRGPFHAEELDNLGYCVRLEELRIIYAGSGTQQVQYGGFPERLTNLTVSPVDGSSYHGVTDAII